MAENGRLVVLKLEGNLESKGFQVSLEISNEGERPHVERTGFLPPNPALVECINNWQRQYRYLGQNNRIRPKEIIYERPKQFWHCQQLAEELRSHLNLWLESESFRVLDQELRTQLGLQELIRILIRTADSYLRRLPWDLWHFIERYPQSEIALAPPDCERVPNQQVSSKKARTKVRILAILGDSSGIDTEADRLTLNNLPNAEVEFLVEPQRNQISDRLWDQPWDILFFAGHSETQQEQGVIHINPQESLTLEELTYALRSAIANGLQLAIFNSCDGLGLIQSLERLNIPQMILMREPVPDRIAQAFLTYFLKAFAAGKPLYLAQRQAREQLQGWENVFPCASWLPVIYQNPATIPWNWPVLAAAGKAAVSPKDWRTQGLAAVGVATAVVALRSLGLLQPWELKAFDGLVRLRPPEPADERILVVTVDETDIQWQKAAKMDLKGSLSDAALAQLLHKLTPHQPRVIALDIIHDFSFTPEASAAIDKSRAFVGICRIGHEGKPESFASIEPPPGLRSEQLGFSNLVLDPDDAIRRQIVGMAPDLQGCKADDSFSFRIVSTYLQDQGMEMTAQGLKIANVTLPRLDHNSGGYELSTDQTRGYQILVNYRAEAPKTIPLREILLGNWERELPNLVKDKIVLIGVDQYKQDRHFTPYNQGENLPQYPGVLVHAQMISQLVSAVEEQRPLFWWWPQWLEILWIAFWSALGAGIGFWRRSLLVQSLAIISAAGVLTGICFWVLLQGGWIPFPPALLALTLTGLGLSIYHQWQSRRSL